MTAHRMDEGWLVWVAARATKTDPQAVLEAADARALVIAVAEVEAAGHEPLDVAAAALTAVACHRPFRSGNRAAAWMAAAVVLADAGIRLGLPDDAAAGLVVGAEHGLVSRDAVRTALAAGRKAGTAAGRGRVLSRSCPVCQRELHAYEEFVVGRGSVLISNTDFELAARCWYEHRAHDRTGRPIVSRDGVEDAGGWRPVVRHDRSASVLVLVDHRAVLLRAVHGAYMATCVSDLAASELAGDWEVLHAGGEPLGRVPAASVRFDATEGMVDWRVLDAAIGLDDRDRAGVPVPA